MEHRHHRTSPFPSSPSHTGARDTAFQPSAPKEPTTLLKPPSAPLQLRPLILPQNNLLKTLIEKTTPAAKDPSKPAQPAYKYIANSTIIQHPGLPSDGGSAGRRGMHSAVGAFWNTERDGTLSYKWDGAEKKGMDVVVSVNWVGI